MSFATMSQVLRESMDWCSRPSVIRSGFRTVQLEPPAALLQDPVGYSLDHGPERLVEVVAILCAARRELLSTVPAPHGSGAPGRVLVSTAIQESVVDGASAAASAGWFDGNDLPPWDTWLGYARVNTRRFTDRFALFAFVPDTRTEVVMRGMKVNPVDCIEWATEADMHALLAGDTG